jgi:transposase InsO family protein
MRKRALKTALHVRRAKLDGVRAEGNAPMESCFGTIKTELVHQACYPTRKAARHDLLVYIEGYYNRQRLHSALGYINPKQAGRQAA